MSLEAEATAKQLAFKKRVDQFVGFASRITGLCAMTMTLSYRTPEEPYDAPLFAMDCLEQDGEWVVSGFESPGAGLWIGLGQAGFRGC